MFLVFKIILFWLFSGIITTVGMAMIWMLWSSKWQEYFKSQTEFSRANYKKSLSKHA